MVEKPKPDMKVITWMVYWEKKTHLWISLLSIFWWEPDPCTQMDFTRLWRHWDDMPSSSAGTFKKMVHSAGSRNACRPAYWLTMAWHSCNVISGFIVNAFINHHLSTININKRPNWSSTVVLLGYSRLTDEQCPVAVAGSWRTTVHCQNR